MICIRACTHDVFLREASSENRPLHTLLLAILNLATRFILAKFAECKNIMIYSSSLLACCNTSAILLFAHDNCIITAVHGGHLHITKFFHLLEINDGGHLQVQGGGTLMVFYGTFRFHGFVPPV